MKLLIRIVAIAAGVILLLVGLLAAYMALVFDPNDYRDQLAVQVHKQTGRELVIAGDIGLSVFPWLGVGLERVSLGDAPGFGEEPFARIERAELRARLMPLVRGEVEVDRVVLHGLALKLVRDANGRGNWEDLARPDDPEAPETARDTDPAAAASGVAFVVGGVEVESASVSWHDMQAGARHELTNVSLKLGEVRPGVRFPLAFGLDVNSSSPPLAGRLDLSGQVLVDAERSAASIQALTLRFDGRGEGLPGGALAIALDAALELDMVAGTMQVSDLTLDAAGVRASGELNGIGLLDKPVFTGRLSVAEFNPREVLRALGQTLPAFSHATALTRASLSSGLEASAGGVSLKGLELRLDDSVLRGDAGIADFTRQSLRFDLVLDSINADHYLAPQQDKPAAADQPAVVATPGAAAAGIDPAVLRSLDLDGRFRLGELIMSGLRMSDIDINAKAADGVMRLAPLSAALYQGRYAGNIGLDARGSALRVSLDESLSGVQIGPLLKDLTGQDARLTGNANLKARLQAVGNEPDALKRSLGGAAEFRFADGAVKGVNVAQFLREAAARLRGQPVPAESGPNQTDFTELTGSAQISNGVVRNDDLLVSSPLLRVNGRGTADLGAERIDYRIQASVVGTLAGQGGAELESLRGVTVPIRVGGSFSQPTYALDVESLLTETAKQQARERIEERLQEKIPENLQDNIRKGLRGLLR